RLTQEQSFHAAGYESERIRKVFLNSDIKYRHFFFGGTPNLEETSDQQNQRYLSGAVKTGCRAILHSLESAGRTVRDVDFLAVCTCTGYTCSEIALPHTSSVLHLQLDFMRSSRACMPSPKSTPSRFPT